MARTRSIAAVAIIGFTLAACGGGVDREGFRDELVEVVESSGGEIDADCVDEALDQYSDDEIEAMDEAVEKGESSADADALMADIIGCVSVGG